MRYRDRPCTTQAAPVEFFPFSRHRVFPPFGDKKAAFFGALVRRCRQLFPLSQDNLFFELSLTGQRRFPSVARLALSERFPLLQRRGSDNQIFRCGAFLPFFPQDEGEDTIRLQAAEARPPFLPNSHGRPPLSLREKYTLLRLDGECVVGSHSGAAPISTSPYAVPFSGSGRALFFAIKGQRTGYEPL